MYHTHPFWRKAGPRTCKACRASQLHGTVATRPGWGHLPGSQQLHDPLKHWKLHKRDITYYKGSEVHMQSRRLLSLCWGTWMCSLSSWLRRQLLEALPMRADVSGQVISHLFMMRNNT